MQVFQRLKRLFKKHVSIYIDTYFNNSFIWLHIFSYIKISNLFHFTTIIDYMSKSYKDYMEMSKQLKILIKI